MKDLKLGWFNQITKILNSYGLTDDLNVIKNTPIAVWRRSVTMATEAKNKSRLLEDLHKTVNGETLPKTKTKTIIDDINSNVYVRKPLNVLMSLTTSSIRTKMRPINVRMKEFS